jgi:putative ABC transport system permease protein
VLIFDTIKELWYNKWTTLLYIIQLAITTAILSNIYLVYQVKITELTINSGIAERQIVSLMVRQTSDNVDIDNQIRMVMHQYSDHSDVVNMTPINGVPLSNGGGWYQGFRVSNNDSDPTIDGTLYMTTEQGVATLGIELVEGRNFYPHEVSYQQSNDYNLPTVVIINKSLAEALFDQQSPIGKHLFMPEDPQQPLTVIGVIDKLHGIWPNMDEFAHTVIVPRVDLAFRTFYLFKFARDVDQQTIDTLVNDLHQQMPSVLIERVATVAAVRTASFQASASLIQVLNTIAVLVLLLSLVCVVVISIFEVRRQARFHAVSFVLGLSRAHIMKGVVVRNIILLVLALAIGMPLAIYCSVFISATYHTGLLTAGTLLLSAGVLLLVVLIASIIPGWLAGQGNIAKLIK